ncbi:MAG TPA: Ig-like domain-containing protein [Gemmatimonadaceae bacterium]|nr:Ig-like domain-containing protein [Gemmatimonadaceae bacterium]
MYRPPNRALAVRAIALVIACAAIGGCTLNTDVSGPAGLVKSSGDLQTAPINTPLPSPFVVIVVDQFGAPLGNVTVNWRIVSGGGSISSTPTPTNGGGIASTSYTTGPTSGTATINAQVHGLNPVTFTVTIS